MSSTAVPTHCPISIPSQMYQQNVCWAGVVHTTPGPQQVARTESSKFLLSGMCMCAAAFLHRSPGMPGLYFLLHGSSKDLKWVHGIIRKPEDRSWSGSDLQALSTALVSLKEQPPSSRGQYRMPRMGKRPGESEFRFCSAKFPSAELVSPGASVSSCE